MDFVYIFVPNKKAMNDTSEWTPLPKNINELNGREIKVGTPYGTAGSVLIVTVRDGLFFSERGNEYNPKLFTHYKRSW